MLTGVKLAVFLGIVSRLFYLQISENIKYRSLSDKNRLREWKVPPQRGIIEDFFGKKFLKNFDWLPKYSEYGHGETLPIWLVVWSYEN